MIDIIHISGPSREWSSNVTSPNGTSAAASAAHSRRSSPSTSLREPREPASWRPSRHGSLPARAAASLAPRRSAHSPQPTAAAVTGHFRSGFSGRVARAPGAGSRASTGPDAPTRVLALLELHRRAAAATAAAATAAVCPRASPSAGSDAARQERLSGHLDQQQSGRVHPRHPLWQQ